MDDALGLDLSAQLIGQPAWVRSSLRRNTAVWAP